MINNMYLKLLKEEIDKGIIIQKHNLFHYAPKKDIESIKKHGIIPKKTL